LIGKGSPLFDIHMEKRKLVFFLTAKEQTSSLEHS